MSTRNGPTPIQAAADLAGVDIAQIRRWADVGGIEIQRRGGIETVILERVMALSASVRRRRSGGDRDSLRARLADAEAENRKIPDPQHVARDDRPE